MPSPRDATAQGRQSVPIPSTSQPKRRKSGVLQSSLEIAFSYSRSQQKRYGGPIRSVPSFVDGSRSWSSLDGYGATGNQRDEEEWGEYGPGDEDGEYDEEEEEGYGSGGVSRLQSTPEEEEEEDDMGGEVDYARRRSSGSAGIFPHDPVRLSPTDSTQQQIATTRAATGSGPGQAPTILSTPSSLSKDLTTPRPGLLTLFRTASNSDSSSSNTPKTVYKGLPQARRPTLGDLNEDPTASPTRGEVEGHDLVREPQDDSGRSPIGGITRRQSLSPGEGTPLLPSGTIASRRRSSTTKPGINSGLSVRISSPERPRRGSGFRRRAPDVGESTEVQTLFNACAVLVGIGLLSLPLAFAYVGWIGGTLMLLGFAFITCHTAKLLARLILSDRTLLGYTDIGMRAFGPGASGAISMLFCLELFGLSVALVVLFGDSLEAIFPSVDSNTFKILAFFIVLPTTLLPLHLLSLPSLLSTLSSLLLIVILLLDGFSKSEAPGSLLHPAKTNLGPEWKDGNWLGGIGLILAGFGGHAVIPGLARDMKRPEHFDQVINKAFIIATTVSFIAGAAGYLMIGNSVSDEITRDLLQSKYNYPRTLNLFALWMIVINPLTKFGLCTRPLNVTIETLLGISPSTPGDESQILTSSSIPRPPVVDRRRSSSDLPTTLATPTLTPTALAPAGHEPSDPTTPSSPSVKGNSNSGHLKRPSTALTPLDSRKTAYRVMARIVITACCTLTAVLLPGFGKVMAFLGSFSAFLICIILPLLFYVRLSPQFWPEENAGAQRTVHGFLVLFSIGLMIAGTVWAFLPSSGHGDIKP